MDDTVCVVGSSHSAILVLMNLLSMEQGPRVVNLYRSALKYAREGPGGRIILDNTGLKVRSGRGLVCLKACCLAMLPAMHSLAGLHRSSAMGATFHVFCMKTHVPY